MEAAPTEAATTKTAEATMVKAAAESSVPKAAEAMIATPAAGAEIVRTLAAHVSGKLIAVEG